MKNYKVCYKKISYKNEILKWIENSIRSIESICNLKISLEQYRGVVKSIHNNHIPKVIDFYHFLKNKDNKQDIINLLWEYKEKDEKEIQNIKGEFLYRFFRSFESFELKNVNYYVSNENNKVRIYSKEKCKKWFNKEKNQYRNFATFYKLNDTYLFCVFAGKLNIHFGIVKHKNYKIVNLVENENIFNRLKYRNFSRFKWFSVSYKLKDNLDMLYDFNTFYKTKKIEDIFEHIINQT